MKKIEKSIELGGRKLTLTTGYLAQQATASVLASYGETVVLATVVAAPLRNDPGYFPLTVDYQEKLYAGGRIKGSRWVKREGRPTDEEILAGRLIDRSVRPLFPKGYKEEVQIIITVLSVDLENSPEIISAVAASAALHSSNIPWQGPVGVVKIGLKDNKLVVNPNEVEVDSSYDMDLVVSSTNNAVVMIEAGIKQIPEEKVLEAIVFAQGENKKIHSLIEDFAKAVGNQKREVSKKTVSKDLEKKIRDLAKDKIGDLISKMASKEAGYTDYDIFKSALISGVNDEEKADVSEIFEELYKTETRKLLLSGKRPDGRKPDQLRSLSAEVGVLPRTHGSAIFNRGQTQALSVVTLGAPSLGQSLESAEGEETKRYMHHYSMPPFSTGEVSRVGSPSRREIGHGALAERALLPVIPSEEKFPYAIRVVTEILGSNGSTSMASTCGSTLSLMDAGVPISDMVAGIAMGVVIENDKEFVVLTDIVGIEDGNGDMDFKVAGTQKGITALQLDVKTLKLTADILKEAFGQAKLAREEIMAVMKKTIGEPNKSVSIHAPKIKTIKIDTDKIGELIGPGGRVIKGIIAASGAQVDVDDNGNVFISAMDTAAVDKAYSIVEGMTKDVSPGEIYDGEVKRILNFGAFVEILPGKEGLVHVSDMSMDFVKDPSDIVNIGDKIKVRVKEIDEMGRLNLSMLLDGDKPKIRREDNTGQGGRSWGNKPSYGREKRFDRRRPSGGVGGGPHFPTSRLVQDNNDRGFR